MKFFARTLIKLLLICFVPLAMAGIEEEGAPLGGEDTTPIILPNNFAGVHTWDYPSGLRVHFKAMPHVSNVYVTAVLPAGSRLDPRGREGLAHFVEHMLFTDHRGKSEEEIKQSVLDRGGRKNAITTRYSTRYFVDMPSAEWAFAINWMHDLLTDHQFSESVVDAERKVVVLEKSRRESASIEWWDELETWLRANKLLVKPDYWMQDFGLEREYRSVLGTYASLNRIRATDIQAFYDRYYGPQNVTLVIAGNANPVAVKNLLDQTFAHWQPRGEALSPNQEATRYGSARRVSFAKVKNVDHRILFKLYSTTDYDLEYAELAARILRHQLNQRLRLELKATYGVTVNLEVFAGHAALNIAGNYATEEMPRVTRVIDAVLEELKSGELDRWEFEGWRNRAVGDLYLSNQTAVGFANYCEVDALCNKSIYSSFPDKITLWQGVSKSELGTWLAANLKDSNKVVSITQPIPGYLLWLEFAGPLVVVLLLFYGLHYWWRQPVQMTEIRYISKLRFPWTLLIAAAAAAFLLGLGAAIVGYRIYEQVLAAISLVDSYLFQRAVIFALIGVVAALLLVLPALIPRKLLLFTDGWRLKFWSFRSAVYDYSDIRELRECSFWSLLFSRRAFTTLFLHWGLFRKGVYIRVGDRFGYFLRVRDNGELIAQIKEVSSRESLVASEQSPSIWKPFRVR